MTLLRSDVSELREGRLRVAKHQRSEVGSQQSEIWNHVFNPEYFEGVEHSITRYEVPGNKLKNENNPEYFEGLNKFNISIDLNHDYFFTSLCFFSLSSKPS